MAKVIFKKNGTAVLVQATGEKQSFETVSGLVNHLKENGINILLEDVVTEQ
jgi:hypothetical protein